jgi:hypothetical protein
VSALVTPCHGAPLTIYTQPENNGSYYSTEVPDEIICLTEGCHNYWNADGTVGYYRAP